MSKLKINHYIPNKEDLKKQKELLVLKDLKNKKKKRLVLFSKFLNLFITLFLIFTLFYFFYIKNIFNLQFISDNSVENSKKVLIKNYNTVFHYFNLIKEKFILLSDNQYNKDYIINNTKNHLQTINGDNEFIKIFKSRLESRGLTYASSSEVDEFGDLKIYIKNSLNNNGYIILNTNLSDPENVWKNFISSVSNLDLKSKLDNDLKNLEYIDLRFDNKVFYKFYNINNISTNNASST